MLFELLFSKRLTRIQWISLILLTLGCIVKQISYSHKSSSSSSSSSTESANSSSDLTDYINTSLLLILVQVFSSCFAGVYNEYLLKEKDNNVDIMLQNFFMYVDSIVCNLVLLSFYVPSSGQSSGGLVEAFSYESLQNVFTLKVVLIMLNNAAIGIVTSFFLKFLNSILKAFASALELMFTGILSWLIFGIELDFTTVLAIIIVSFATWLYSKNPVYNTPANNNSSQSNSTSSEKV